MARRKPRASPADIIPMDSPLALTDLVKFQPDDCEHLRDPEHRPVDHPRLYRLDAQDTGAIFEEIRAGDILLHHPYQDFDTYIVAIAASPDLPVRFGSAMPWA
jgi:polyphosphate kinase